MEASPSPLHRPFQNLRAFHFIFTATAVLSLLASCEKASDKETEPETAEKTASASVSKGDLKSAIAFARKAEAAVKNGDREFLAELIDFETIIVRALDGIDVPKEFMDGVRSGMKNAKSGAADQLLSSKLTYLEMREVDGGKPAALFRIIGPDGSLEYLEYQLERKPDTADDWVVTEAYTYSVGTYVSDLLRSMVAPMLAQLNKNLVQRLFTTSERGELLEYMPRLQEMRQLTQSGDAEKALEIWKDIPASVQKDKFAMLMHMQAASLVPGMEKPDSEYFKSLKAYEKAFPGDPSLALHSIDLYFLQGDYVKTYEAIDSLNKKVNDPYLEFYKAFVKLAEKKYDESEKIARDWIQQQPDSIEGWEIIFEIGFASDNHKLTAEALTKLEKEFGQDYGGIAIAPEFGKFRDSPEGQAWLSARN